MNKYIVALLLFFISTCTFSAEYPRATKSDIYECACRIYCSDGLAGSGTVVYNDPIEGALILTNYHVAGKSQKITLHFMGTGKIVEVDASTVWRGYNAALPLDAVFLEVPADKMRGACLSYIPISLGITPNKDVFIVTCGAPQAKWLKLIRGTIESVDARTFSFRPTPYGGQSGSSIIAIDDDGLPVVIGLLTWRTMDEGIDAAGGLAQKMQPIIDSISGNSAQYVDAYVLPENAVEVPYFIKEN